MVYSTAQRVAEPLEERARDRKETALLLLDGNSLAYRAFFALPTDMATAAGQVTNSVFGFTSMLINLLKDHQPDHIAVAFDRPEPTFRHAMIDFLPYPHVLFIAERGRDRVAARMKSSA